MGRKYVDQGEIIQNGRQSTKQTKIEESLRKKLQIEKIK